MNATKRPSKTKLQKNIDGIIALAKTLTPDVAVEIQIPGYEGQHAWLALYVPSEFDDQVDELVSQRVYDIFVETGYAIGAQVYEKAQTESIPA